MPQPMLATYSPIHLHAAELSLIITGRSNTWLILQLQHKLNIVVERIRRCVERAEIDIVAEVVGLKNDFRVEIPLLLSCLIRLLQHRVIHKLLSRHIDRLEAAEYGRRQRHLAGDDRGLARRICQAFGNSLA